MLRYVSSGMILACSVSVGLAQEQTAPPTLMAPFTGSKPLISTAPVPGLGRPLTLTPLFEMPKMNQPKPAPGGELKPEHGEWVIEVKSYAQVESGLMAEALAKEIRELHKAPVYLFEWGAEARKKRDEEESLTRKRIEEELRPFVDFQEKLRKEAEKNGEVFDETPIRTKVPVYYRELTDQYMVVVGGYKDIESARKALDVIRRWPMPKDSRLLDRVETSGMRDGKQTFEVSFVNPFAEAKIVRNMTWPKQVVQERDEFLVKLNDGEPLSILKSNKKWTLIVKGFNVPTTNAGVDTKQPSNRRGPTAGSGAKAGQWLDATAQQAAAFCTALRKMTDRDNRPVGFDAFVLHHRTGTLVTVGQYDSPEDPAMQADMRRIQELSFNKNENKNNTPGMLIAAQQKLFDGATPMLIPK